MSKLIKLLKEQSSAPKEISGTMFRKYTDIGNLFRLMIVMNDEDSFPLKGKLNIVSKMLPTLSEEHSDEVKKLQTSFNKIKKRYKSSKNPTIAMKKEYYNILFKLLLPMLDKTSFKINTLVNNFASNSSASKTFKRKATILLGKAILTSKLIDINDKDRLMIKSYISSMEKIDKNAEEQDDNTKQSNSDNTKDNSSEEEQKNEFKSKVDNIIDNASDKELDKYINKTEIANKIIQNDIYKHEERAEKLKSAINEIQNIEDLLITDDSTFESGTIAVINETLKEIHARVLIMKDRRYANFVTLYVKNALKDLNRTTGYIDYFKNAIKVSLHSYNKESFEVDIKVGQTLSNDESEIFYMDRTFSEKNGELEVKHERLIIPLSLENSSINKKIFKNALDLYKAMDVKKITLDANIDVGGYAWFRYGFKPRDLMEIKKISTWINDVLLLSYKALQYDKDQLADVILERSHNKSDELINLTNLIRQGQSNKAEEVFQALAVSCSKEFKSTYSTIEKMKSLQKDIALKNFKPVKIKGMNYTISYKALFSIQAIKDESGISIIPLNDIYLNWSGELYMDDLESTFIYLNGK